MRKLILSMLFVIALAMPSYSQTLGTQTVFANSDYTPASMPNTFPIVATSNLTAQSLSVYVNTGNAAKSLVVGIYSSNSANTHPSTLLAKATISTLTTGTWVQGSLSTGVSIVSGKKYWIGFVASGGNFNFRRDAVTGCKNETASNNTTLPTTWSTSATYNGCPLSAFASGTGTPPPTQYTLSTTKNGTGTGTLTPSSGTYNAGTVVSITQSADSGSVFAGWSGACSGTGSCSVTLNANTSVTAIFNLVNNPPPTQYTLTTSTNGTGSGTVTPTTGLYNAGTVVNVTQSAASGSTFAGWSGACSGTGSCSVTLNANTTVTATFNITTTGTGIWNLAFSDEFDGNTLDTTKWNVNYPNFGNAFPSQWTNNSGEIECMMPDDVLVSGGSAHIKSERRTVNCPDGNVYNYTSGVLASWNKFSQTGGYFEARMQLATGNGLWPSFWMIPNSGVWPPEIDIFEQIAGQTSLIYMNLHWMTGSTHNSDSSTFSGPNFASGFHTFAIDWQPTYVKWYVDGQLVKTETGSDRVPTVPFYMILQQAIGGWGGNPSGTSFPKEVLVDYVRVYNRVSSGGCYATIPSPTTIPNIACQ